MVKDTTLYDVLEISPEADESQIKKAFNKLSKKWHPDKHSDNIEEATKKFQEINQAKEILLNKEKRDLYDQIGMDILKAESQGMPGQGQHPFGDFGNIFGSGFPFGMPGMPGFHRKNQQNENIVDKINVSLEQLFKEEVINFTYKQKQTCVKCNEEGSNDGKSTMCSSCDGKGIKVQVIRMGPMIQQAVGECHSCKGKGKVIKPENKCDSCDGKGYTYKEKTIQIPLKSGLTNGNKINLSGKGHQLKSGKTDLIIIINELPHKIFKRHQNDLFINIELKLYQALFGFDKIINHLDGRKLHISHSGKTDLNMVRRISKEGMKSLNSDKGDLYIRFIVSLPNFNSLSAEYKTQLKSLLQINDKNEVLQEVQIPKTPNLTKTILTDCKPEQVEQINILMENIKYNNTEDNDSDEGRQQCVHQ
jgi:DnaJ family protein A protein 2